MTEERVDEARRQNLPFDHYVLVQMQTQASNAAEQGSKSAPEAGKLQIPAHERSHNDTAASAKHPSVETPGRGS